MLSARRSPSTARPEHETPGAGLHRPPGFAPLSRSRGRGGGVLRLRRAPMSGDKERERREREEWERRRREEEERKQKQLDDDPRKTNDPRTGKKSHEPW